VDRPLADFQTLGDLLIRVRLQVKQHDIPGDVSFDSVKFLKDLLNTIGGWLFERGFLMAQLYVARYSSTVYLACIGWLRISAKFGCSAIDRFE
jgi:hypothetical protein